MREGSFMGAGPSAGSSVRDPATPLGGLHSDAHTRHTLAAQGAVIAGLCANLCFLTACGDGRHAPPGATDAGGVADGSAPDASTELDAGPPDDGGTDSGSLLRPCTSTADCDDHDPCTEDQCSADYHHCVWTGIAGCIEPGCDQDDDGYASTACGGRDCDDTNANVHPGAPEDCTNGIDDNCNGLVDTADPDCIPHSTNDTCSSAIEVTDGAHVTGSFGVCQTMTPDWVCGPALYYTLTLSQTSDVDVRLTMETPSYWPPGPSGASTTIEYGAFLESACGSTTTSTGFCQQWDPADPSVGGWGPTYDVSKRRLPPGTYTIRLEASEVSDTCIAMALPFQLDVSARPSTAPDCGSADALVDGATVHASTTGAVDSFAYDCAGNTVSAPENLYTLTLTSRRRVRLFATSSGGSTDAPRVEIYPACDPDGSRIACIDGADVCVETNPTDSIETTLDAGTYTVVVEGTSGTLDYDLTVMTEAPGAACATPYDTVTASTSLSGTTVVATDEFRNPNVCGDDAGNDRLYALVVDTDRRVVLDLIASFTGADLTLYSDCGDTVVARDTSHLDMTLSAGTYYVVVDAAHAVDAGSYVLNATLL